MKESNVRASMRELCLPDSPAVPRTGCRERVQVVVRCRPLSEKEIADGHQNCVIVDAERNTVEIHGSGRRGSQDMAPKVFTFDRTYGGSCSQEQLYNEVARPIVHSVMLGYNGTVLAYGQTASGKTFTMEGLDSPPDMKGIIPNAFEDIFAYINQSQSSDHFLVRASYLEIYNEEIRDLLAPRTSATMKLELKETGDAGIFVKNLTSLSVYSLSDISRLLTVDLAGSERMCKTGATGDRFKELTNINWSLSALGNVISALVDGKSAHIPYRDSKLTRLLQDSLGGNTRTVMVANIGPADYNLEESISTLRYANRAKNIRNKPCINEDPKDTLLREFQAEIFS
ncbi:hypothetical protein O6H91_03G100000 [Diphasiastrum complanatum]|uniref:Uncharacterized protein n=1 Tax=Diphasiastrum complanatum TaxID=34168 RepID=A0ACC2E9L1_DIPCM|nr:hypothetical protein O6H91_03G100000 [Diphasiastrum complanatum]